MCLLMLFWVLWHTVIQKEIKLWPSLHTEQSFNILEHNEMYTVITEIWNANGFAIGSVVSLRQSWCTQRKSKLSDHVTMTSEHTVSHQVFLILLVYVELIVFSSEEARLCLINTANRREINIQFMSLTSHLQRWRGIRSEVCVPVLE